MSDFNLGTVTAYGYAKDKGYTGTEDEFAALMASYADVAEQAAESATQAAASATTATAKASEAAASATAAASSKTAAETAQTGAETAAQTATTKAGEASASATTASGKATEATTAAGTATTKASEATTAATTATTKAGEASTSATNAAASATRAQEILDSIPADYSQLSDDVEDLKDGLTAIESDVTDLKNDFANKANVSNTLRKYPIRTSIDTTGTAWTNVIYNTSTGAFDDNTNYLMSDYIPLNISNSGYSTVSVPSGLYCGIYIFDGSKNYVSNKTPVSDGGTLDINNVKDGYYCRILLRYNPASPISPSIMDNDVIVIHPNYDVDFDTLIAEIEDEAFIERYAKRSNKFPVDAVWYIGQVNSANAIQTSSKRITTKIIPFPYNHFKIDFVDSTYNVYAKFYDASMTVVAYTTGNDYISTDLEINRTQKDIKYAVFNVKRADNGAFLPSDASSITVKITDLESLTNTKLTVCSYNVGEYQNGTGNDDIEHPELVVPTYRQFYTRQNFDIIGLQEAHTYGWGNTYGPTADDALYNYLYPYKEESTNLTALLSRYAFKESGSGWLQESDTDHRRKYVYAVINIDGNDVWLYSVHLNPVATYRALDITELISLLGTRERFICFGDFNFGNDNDNAQTEINNFLSAGYKVASGSYLGLVATSGVGEGETRKYPDNVITSSNINIFNVEAVGNISDLYSDHLPLKVELTVY